MYDANTGLPCMTMFGQVQGAAIVELIETTTGQLCPCRQGLRCPMVPQASVMLEVVTSPRAS